MKTRKALTHTAATLFCCMLIASCGGSSGGGGGGGTAVTPDTTLVWGSGTWGSGTWRTTTAAPAQLTRDSNTLNQSTPKESLR